MGQIAYEAYREFSGKASLVTGDYLPHWDMLPDEIQKAWRAAAGAVVELYVCSLLPRVIES